MTGVELIISALAAGAGAGVTDTISGAIVDAYSGLKQLLGRRLADRQRATEALDGQETESGMWQALIGPDLREVGADQDEEILAAAQRVLEAVRTNTYTVKVDTNYGAAGVFTAPITITNHLPYPPASPETV